jgi:hypothetical protein
LTKRLLPLAAVAAVITAGCGSTQQLSQTSQAPVARTTTVVIERAAPAVRSRASSSPTFAGCGGYVEALADTTSCEFANNVFYEFYEVQPERQFSAYSPATGKSYDVRCTGQSLVTCTGGQGAKVRFPLSAVSVYTDSDATAYASSHDLGPGASAGAGQAAEDTSAVPAVGDGSFCDTHACIDNFDNGSGYVVKCADGEWSHSGGRPGACSYHGGETGDTYP